MNPKRFDRVITPGPGGVERVLIVQHPYAPGKGGKGWFDAITAEGDGVWAYDEDIIANLGPLDDRKPKPVWDMSDPEDGI